MDLVNHFGSKAATARAFGIKAASVSEWIANGRVPIDRQCQGEVLTGGLLRADRAQLAMPAAPSRAEAA